MFLLILIVPNSVFCRSSDLLKQMADMFNQDQDFDDFVIADDTTSAVMSDVLCTLHPEYLPGPGPLVPDQLLKIINWTRAASTKILSKYDLSGHYEHGDGRRLRDIYDNFCVAGDNCADPIDRPKVACFMFATLGMVFNQVR